jgi:AcrR family transcriptional regulator
MARAYTMGRRGQAQAETRERILRATMMLHDEQGVAATTFADVAARAGVGPATVSRHFPTINALVMACGGHVWQQMRPPVHEQAAPLFAGIDGQAVRLERLIDELDAFYARGALRLHLAGRDRHLLPELDGFLAAVEAGVAALVAEALAPSTPRPATVALAIALAGFPVWQMLDRLGLAPQERRRTHLKLLSCAIAGEA